MNANLSVGLESKPSQQSDNEGSLFRALLQIPVFQVLAQ